MEFSFIKNLQKIAFKVKMLLKKRGVLLYVQVLLIAASIFLATLSLHSSRKSFSLSSINLGLLILGVIFYVIFYIIMSIHWSLVLSIVERQNLKLTQTLAFFASQPYKYLPTSAFSISSRSIYSKKVGARNIASTAKAQLVEYASIFLSGLLVVALVKSNLSASITITLTIIIFISLLTTGLYSYKITNPLYKYISLLFIIFCAWAVSGFSLFLIMHATGYFVSYSHAVYLNTATLIASLAAVLVPAGIGIREAILFGQNIGFSGVLVWRSVSVFVDVVTGALAILKINRKNKS